MRRKKGKTISTNITRAQDEMIEALVEEGFWASRSEFIRSAINNSLEDELKKLRDKKRK